MLARSPRHEEARRSKKKQEGWLAGWLAGWADPRTHFLRDACEKTINLGVLDQLKHPWVSLGVGRNRQSQDRRRKKAKKLMQVRLRRTRCPPIPRQVRVGARKSMRRMKKSKEAGGGPAAVPPPHRI
jgi:hypothetical protein